MGLPVLFFFAAITGSALLGYGPGDVSAGTNEYIVRSADPAVHLAGQLLNSSRAAQALELLRPAMERHRRDPGVLLLAGLAAFRADQLREALCYWKQSLDLAPNDALNAMYEDARREAQADRSNDKLYSAHIALRYEGGALSEDAARFILAALEEDYLHIAALLGCNSGEPIIAIVQSREQYLHGASAAEWSGGHYDGRIHIAWSVGSEPIQRALAHELAHACLAGIPSGPNPWPIWLQEGLAQRLSGDRLSPSDRAQLRQRARARGIPRLENLGQDWFSLSRHDAVAAYDISLAAVDELDNDAILNLLTHPEILPSLTSDLDAEFGL